MKSSSSQEPSAPGKPGKQFKSSVFKNADSSNLERPLVEGNKDHLVSQAKSELAILAQEILAQVSRPSCSRGWTCSYLHCEVQFLCGDFFCIFESRLMGRRGWSAMPIPDGWVQVIRGPRPKSENCREETQVHLFTRVPRVVRVHREDGGGIHLGRVRPSCGVSRPLWQFQVPKSPEPEPSFTQQCSAPRRGRKTIAAIFTDTGFQGGSSCQSLQVGESFGRIGRHQRGRGRDSREGSRESQSSCTREASHRVDCRLQGVHRSRRKTIGEVGGRESVGDRFVGRRSCPSCTFGSSSRGWCTDASCSTFFSIGCRGVPSPRRVRQCAGSLKHQCRPPRNVCARISSQTLSRRQRCG